MARWEKILTDVLSGRRDTNIRFTQLTGLLDALGFQHRIKASHHIYFRDDIEEIINLQPATGGKAKPYQVKRVRRLITRYHLGLEA